MIAREIHRGRLQRKDWARLGNLSKAEQSQLDTSDIALMLRQGGNYNILELSDAHAGLVHRSGSLDAIMIDAKHFVNDAIILQSSNVDVEMVNVVHDVPFTYSKYNHADAMQIYAYNKKLIKNVRIRSVDVEISGKGFNDKGIVMLTEICRYYNFKLFSQGFKVTTNPRYKRKSRVPSTYYKQPAFNATNLQNSVLGSKRFPLNNEDLEGRTIRIKGVKRGSPKTYAVKIYAKAGVRFEFTPETRKGIEIIYS